MASFILKEHGPGGFLLPTRLSVSMGQTKETKHAVEIKIRALGHFKYLILTVVNKYNANVLNDVSVLFKAMKDGSYCKAVVNDSHPVRIPYSKTLEIVRIDFRCGSWNRSGIPQHTIS